MQLIEERDKEIDDNEKSIQNLQQQLSDKDEELRDAHTKLHTSETSRQKTYQQLKEAEQYYQNQINDIRSGMEAARDAHEQEIRQWEKDYQALKEELEDRLSDKDKTMEHQRNELIEMYDTSIKQVKE